MRHISFSKILVPVDFSPQAEEAARYAKRLALHFKSELILLHVMEPLPLGYSGYSMVDPYPESVENLSVARRAAVKSMLDRFTGGDLAGVPLRTIVAEGDAAGQIVSCSKTEGVNLIVMPTRGHSRLRRFLIGSVTAKVLHDSEIPVLTGSHLDETTDFPPAHARTILCAVDLKSQSEMVLKWGGRLAEEFGAAVHVIHVTESNSPDQQPVDQQLKNIAATVPLDLNLTITSGEPSKAVAATALQLGADLVVIGRGSTDGQLGRLRAQAYAIVRQSPCPVLSV
jgi:nucleotide-binding universal stress UspA family protein